MGLFCGNNHTYTRLQNGLASVEDLVAALGARVPYIHLESRSLSPTNHPESSDDRSFIVWRAECTGCRVTGGTINLLPGCILLLTGHGVHFTNTTFSGTLSLISALFTEVVEWQSSAEFNPAVT